MTRPSSRSREGVSKLITVSNTEIPRRYLFEMTGASNYRLNLFWLRFFQPNMLISTGNLSVLLLVFKRSFYARGEG